MHALLAQGGDIVALACLHPVMNTLVKFKIANGIAACLGSLLLNVGSSQRRNSDRAPHQSERDQRQHGDRRNRRQMTQWPVAQQRVHIPRAECHKLATACGRKAKPINHTGITTSAQ